MDVETYINILLKFSSLAFILLLRDITVDFFSGRGDEPTRSQMIITADFTAYPMVVAEFTATWGIVIDAGFSAWFGSFLYSYHRYLPNLHAKDTRASGLWGGYIFLREGGISRVWCRLERQTYWRLLRLASPDIPIILTNDGIHMASIYIAMRHFHGVNMQYVALSQAEEASITNPFVIAAFVEGSVGVSQRSD